jgi:ectoine hydroxylase-related dioxygenase (phytanoyl-CoA dioxygenase family)
MGQAAKRLMEREVAIRYWADMIAVKLPVSSTVPSTATPLHQDYSNKHFDRTGNVTFWMALEDTPAEKGTCRFRNGSHMLGPLGHEFGRKHPGGSGRDIHDVYPWLAERCPLSEPRDMKAGDVTVHGGLTLHCAPENRSDSPRWTYIALYFPGDALWTGSPFLGMDGADLDVGLQFDHPFFPVICD